MQSADVEVTIGQIVRSRGSSAKTWICHHASLDQVRKIDQGDEVVGEKKGDYKMYDYGDVVVWHRRKPT